MWVAGALAARAAVVAVAVAAVALVAAVLAEVVRVAESWCFLLVVVGGGEQWHQQR